jgi:uncharacterized protein (TIGR03663 family)
MSRGVFWSLVAAALVLGSALRVAAPDIRPMHHDEANQAIRFGDLLETGAYKYDRNDHHGPTLYYLTLPAAWIRGQATLASLDERTLRIVPALFGAGTILLFVLLAAGMSRPTVAGCALLAAVSPALTYYSRFYIQESLFVFFTLGFMIALGRYVLRPGSAWAVAAGLFAGLAYSTKETSLLVLPAALVACVVARAWSGESAGIRAAHVAAGAGAALAVAIAFYTSFFQNPSGIVESVRAFSVYLERGVAPGPHAQPWHYYLGILAFSSSGGVVWSEGFILGLALIGGAFALRDGTTRFWPLYICLYSVMAALVFSAVRYKTPWNLLPFYIGFVLLAGAGATALLEMTGSRVIRLLLVVLLGVGSWHLAMQSWRANFRYPADERNPYAYAQTSTDFERLVGRINALAAVHPDGSDMLVKVVAAPHEQWPLPWYLRRMQRVGYWTTAAEAGVHDRAPVIVASLENAEAVDAALGDGYVSEFYGLRPGTLLALYMDRDLWGRILRDRFSYRRFESRPALSLPSRSDPGDNP